MFRERWQTVSLFNNGNEVMCVLVRLMTFWSLRQVVCGADCSRNLSDMRYRLLR